MKKLIYCLFFFSILFTSDSFSANELWRSRLSGSWTTPATWEFSTDGGGTWIIATSTFPDVNSSTTTIRNPNAVTVNNNTPLAIDQFVIETGGSLTLGAGSRLMINDGAGTDFFMYGTVSGPGAIKVFGAGVSFELINVSSFLAPLVVDSGSVNIVNPQGPNIAEMRGAITIAAGFGLSVNGGGYTVRAWNNVNNAGTISGGGSSFTMRGSSFINTGLVNPTNFNFDSTTLLDGGGTWNGSNINFNSTGDVTINDTVVFGGTAVVNVSINGGGKVSGAGQFILLNGLANQVNLFVNANGTVGNSSTTNVLTRGSASIFVRNSGIFNAALNVKSGTTTGVNDNGPFIAVFNGPIVVDASSVLNVNGGGYTILARSNVTNNGTISGVGSSFTMRGQTFINNGLINSTNFNFDSTTNLSGAGQWANPNININSSGNVLISGNNVAFGSSSVVNFTINTGGTLNPNTRTVTFNGTANTVNFVINNGGTAFNSGLFQTQGTVTLNMRNGSNFDSPLKINTGQTIGLNDGSPFIGNLFNTLTIDNGATLIVNPGGYTLQANNDVINNGSITAAGSSFNMNGSNFANNGTVTPNTFNFNDTTSISGTGTWNPANLNINGNAIVRLSNSLAFGGLNPLNFSINSNGFLNPNNFTATLRGIQNTVNFFLNNAATVINSGLLQSQGNVNILLRNGSQLLSPYRTNTGTTTIFNDNSPFEAIAYNTILVDTGAVLNVNPSGYTLTANDTVTINGTLTGGTFRFFGPVFTNNGIVSSSVFLFESIIFAPTSFHTLQGTGSFTTSNCQILEGANVTLATNHQFLYLTVNAGSTFDLNGKTLKLNGAGTPIVANGSIVTAGSTIEYNGTAAQNFPQSNINYNNVTINDSAGVVLTENINFSGVLQLLKGDLNLNGRVLTFLTSATLSETPGNTVTGNSGFIVTTRNLNAPSSLDVAGLGAVITTTSNLGLTEIKRGPSVQILPSGGQAIRRYYAIKPTNNSGLNATLVFRYDESELNGNNESTLALFKSTDAGASYVADGGIVNTVLNQITKTGIQNFARYTAGSNSGTVNVICMPEAFYNLTTLKLNMKDTITVQLRNNVSPYNVIDSARSTLDSVTFTSSLNFGVASTDTYYVVVKHRNTLETWSKTPQIYTVGGVLNYNFTDLQTKAFGNNEVLVGTKWTFYSGDVNQNGFIDLADVIATNNAASSFASGYVNTDVNGNRVVDLEDVLFAYNNSINFVSVKRP